MAFTLLDAVTEDTNGTPIEWKGGEGTMLTKGDLGGGIATLQVSDDNGANFVTMGTEVTHNAPKVGNFRIQSIQIRAILTGATGPNVNVTVRII